MMISDLKNLETEMKKCFRCSLCKMVPLPAVTDTRYSDCCPASHKYHFHGFSGSGKSIMGLSLLDGRIKADQDLADITFACTACGYCDVACKFIMEAERHTVNMKLREHLVDEGLSPDAHRRMISLHKSEALHDTEWAKKAGIKLLPGESAEILVYGGCIPDLPASAEHFKKLAILLKKAGLDVGILGSGDPCSGIPAYWTGHRDIFVKSASGLTSLLNNLGLKTVVAVSGADLGMLRSKFPEYGQTITPEVLHATEILDSLIKRKELKLNKKINKTVTYHDPCYLGRQSEPPVKWKGEHKVALGCMPYTDPPKPINMGTKGVFDPPRNLIRSIPGIKFREMFRIREYAYCCGGGGGVPEAYPDLASYTALNRIQEAADSGAECIVTACHHCLRNLTAHGDKMPVMDIIDLIAESAGL